MPTTRLQKKSLGEAAEAPPPARGPVFIYVRQVKLEDLVFKVRSLATISRADIQALVNLEDADGQEVLVPVDVCERLDRSSAAIQRCLLHPELDARTYVRAAGLAAQAEGAPPPMTAEDYMEDEHVEEEDVYANSGDEHLEPETCTQLDFTEDEDVAGEHAPEKQAVNLDKASEQLDKSRRIQVLEKALFQTQANCERQLVTQARAAARERKTLKDRIRSLEESLGRAKADVAAEMVRANATAEEVSRRETNIQCLDKMLRQSQASFDELHKEWSEEYRNFKSERSKLLEVVASKDKLLKKQHKKKKLLQESWEQTKSALERSQNAEGALQTVVASLEDQLRAARLEVVHEKDSKVKAVQELQVELSDVRTKLRETEDAKAVTTGTSKKRTAAQAGIDKDVCWDFYFGKCRRGERCKYRHPGEVQSDSTNTTHAIIESTTHEVELSMEALEELGTLPEDEITKVIASVAAGGANAYIKNKSAFVIQRSRRMRAMLARDEHSEWASCKAPRRAEAWSKDRGSAFRRAPWLR